MGKLAHKEKLLALLLVVVLLVMTGCTKTAKQVETMIDEIGTFTDELGIMVDVFAPLKKEAAINKVYQAYSELPDDAKLQVTNIETLMQDKEQLDQAIEMKSTVQTFTEKLFARCAAKLENSDTIKVTGAWWDCFILTSSNTTTWTFTFEVNMTNSSGEKETVYYGGIPMDLSDETIDVASSGIFNIFQEGTTIAKDAAEGDGSTGIALDADAIQSYYQRHR